MALVIISTCTVVVTYAIKLHMMYVTRHTKSVVNKEYTSLQLS